MRSDSDLDIVVTVAINKRGGGGLRLKLGNIPNEINDYICQKKAACLYVPTNADNNLCFS